MIELLPQASRQVFVNRSGRAAACTHDVAAGKDTAARGALGLGIGLYVTAFVCT